MRLTEILVSISIFLIVSVALSSCFINIRQAVAKSDVMSKEAVGIIKTDRYLRKEIKSFDIPYWENFENKFEAFREKIIADCFQNNIEVVSVSSVYDKKHNTEGVSIMWKMNGRDYESREFISQRITDEK